MQPIRYPRLTVLACLLRDVCRNTVAVLHHMPHAEILPVYIHPLVMHCIDRIVLVGMVEPKGRATRSENIF